MVDFKSLLSKPVDSLKPPPVAPAGTYYGTIQSFKFGESGWEDEELGRKEAQVTYLIKVTHADESVDGTEVAASKVIGSLMPTKGFSLEDGREWGLKVFLDGIGAAVAGKTLDTAIPEAVGAAVMFEVANRLGKAGTKNEGRKFADLKQVRAAA